MSNPGGVNAHMAGVKRRREFDDQDYGDATLGVYTRKWLDYHPSTGNRSAATGSLPRTIPELSEYFPERSEEVKPLESTSTVVGAGDLRMVRETSEGIDGSPYPHHVRNGPQVTPSSIASLDTMPFGKFAVFVRRDSGARWVKVRCNPTGYVSNLIATVVQLFQISAPLDSVVLYQASDSNASDVSDAPLDNTALLKDAVPDIERPPRRHYLIVKVISPALVPYALSNVLVVPPRSLGNLRALGDDEHMSKVVAAIRGKLVTKHADGHLLLPKDVKWPMATNNVLFMRKFYQPLYEVVLRKCMPRDIPDEQRRIVTGQPGIGKSVWIWYVVYRTLTEQPERTIIFVSNQEQVGYIIPPTGPVRKFTLSQVSLAEVGDMRDIADDAILLSDSILPPALRYPTLVVSSPGRLAERLQTDTLNAYYEVWHYMPIPSEEEVLAMRAVAFSTVSEIDVRKRMELWGPIPRLVLVKTSLLEQASLWRNAAAVPLEQLMKIARGASYASAHSGDGDAPYRIVHERAAGQDAPMDSEAADPTSMAYYTRGRVVIPSAPILRYVVNRIKAESKWNAALLIDGSVGIGSLGALRGIKFEEAVLAMLKRGARFKCRRLTPKGEKAEGWKHAQPPKLHTNASLTAKAVFKEVQQFAVDVPTELRMEIVHRFCENQGIKLPEEYLTATLTCMLGMC